MTHTDSRDALENWYEVIKCADWQSFAEAKKTFNSIDAVGNDRYVFNVRGNRYRLVALILFKVRTVFILFVGTHKEYDKVDASKIVYKK